MISFSDGTRKNKNTDEFVDCMCSKVIDDYNVRTYSVDVNKDSISVDSSDAEREVNVKADQTHQDNFTQGHNLRASKELLKLDPFQLL